jgi:hypothetical protein
MLLSVVDAVGVSWVMASSKILKSSGWKRSQHLGFIPRVERLESRRFLDASGFAAFDVDRLAEGESADIAPDFSIVDLNPASPTYNQAVSPRDYLGSVSVWMFGYST